jgi:peptidyl-prolyl cis-trans isomerase D
VYTTEAYKNNYATLSADFDKNYGIQVDTLRSVIETSLYREKLQQEVIGQIDCSAEQVWAEHILVTDEATANVVIDQLRAGEDWNKLAKAYSTDTSNKDKGGDLGWFGKGQMVAEFEQAAFNLKPGTITAVPIKTQFGYHIIRVLGHENRPLTPTECTQLSNTKFSDWLKVQHDASKIVQTDFWQTVVPLSPTLSPEITTILKNYAAQQPVPTPQGLPEVPTP